MAHYSDTYSPVDPEVYEIVDQLIAGSISGKIFYFNPKNEVDEVRGRISAIRKTNTGEFLEVNNSLEARLDKVITLFGKPGPAHAQYDRYANACLACEDIDED